MPLVFKKGKIQGYRKPEKKLTKSQEIRRRNASYGSGGKFENNFVRSALGGAGNRIDRAQDERQLRNLKEFPEVQSDRFRNVQKNIRDAASNEGFNFDNLFMGTNLDRRPEDGVRVNPTRDDSFVNNAENVRKEDILQYLPGISPEDITRAIGNTQFDPRVVGSIMTPGMGYGGSALGSYITGGEGVGGLMSNNNPIFDSYSDNSQAYNEMVGNTNKTLLGAAVGSGLPLDRPPPGMGNVFIERPSPGMGGQGGLLTDPRFNFEIGSFGGTGFLDSRLREAIENAGFGNGIGFSNELPASTASGIMGSGGGTINIGNVGNVVDQFGNSLTGNAANAFIQSQFEALKRQKEGERLRNFDLNIIQ